LTFDITFASHLEYSDLAGGVMVMLISANDGAMSAGETEISVVTPRTADPFHLKFERSSRGTRGA
jgi:hypothetical protein